MKKIKAVLFDVDGVLLDSFEANLKFFQDLLVKFGHEAPTRESYSKIFHFSMLGVIEEYAKSANKNEIDTIWEAGKNRDIPYPVNLLKIPNDAEKVLEELHKDYVLGIVTSRVQESIFEAPKMIELKKYFKTVVSYKDTIKHKPDPEPLLLGAKQLVVAPEQCIYVADLKNDVVAAKAAGMKVIVYNKKIIDGADHHTSSFKEILKLVEELS